VLYFSKIKLFVIYSVIIFVSFFFFLNFLNLNDSFTKSKKVNLGLDLQGGSYLLLEVDSSPIIKQNLQQKVVNLRKYLKNNKIKYKNLNLKNETITFELSNNNIEIFEKLFFNKDNSLNFYYGKYRSFEMDLSKQNNLVEIQYSKYGLIELKISTLNQSLEIVRRRIDEVGTNEPTIIKRGNDRILIELPGLEDPNRVKKLLGKTANLTFRLVTDDEDVFGSELVTYEDSENQLNVSKRIMVSGDNLINAQPSFDRQNNQAVVNFTFDRSGTKKFARSTTDNVGKRIAIILDGKIISAPVVQEPIVGGNGQISGEFTFQSATDLALLLRSGALPAPLNIIEERTVGPDLGEDSIKAGAISLAIGFLLVVCYMLFKYKFLGIIANLSLIINLVLLVGILTILEATLTLPGIAGIILTVGMAVDANVLIFERIKEEAKIENSIIHAFDTGYKKAQTAILDANITTLISAIILFILGSGPVKGFAITLGIGIVSTLFCAYFFARHLSSLYVMKNKNNQISI
tara:strand:- start:1184 stop:2737 length:1554 start_codon:yes stop_codon:yes gene_type:complete